MPQSAHMHAGLHTEGWEGGVVLGFPPPKKKKKIFRLADSALYHGMNINNSVF